MKLSNVPAVPATADGATGAFRDELAHLHEGWMGLVFPRQRAPPGAVLGKWTPGTVVGRLKYGLWGALGLPAVALVYAIALVGSPVRLAARRVGGLADTWGLAGVAWSTAFAGATAAVVAWSWTDPATVRAVVAAAVATTLAVSLATVLARHGGRRSAVLLVYPLGLVAVALLPLTAAAHLTAVPELYLGRAVELVTSRVGPYPGMAEDVRRAVGDPRVVVAGWAGVSTVSGWLAGLLVAVADLGRPVDG